MRQDAIPEPLLFRNHNTKHVRGMYGVLFETFSWLDRRVHVQPSTKLQAGALDVRINLHLHGNMPSACKSRPSCSYVRALSSLTRLGPTAGCLPPAPYQY
jgi:hypothetical protein